MKAPKENKGILSYFFKKLKLYTSKNYINYRFRRMQWFFVQKGNKSIEYQFNSNIKVKLYTDRQLSKLIYCNQFEKDEFQFISDYIKPGYVVYDIGANIGLHSLFLADVIGSGGCCYSFEPTKATFDSLNENISLNTFNNIFPYNIALSDKEETLQIYKSTNGYDAWNSLGGFQKIGNNQYDLESVQCIPLDTFLERNPDVRKPDFIKIDTEGWELHVLKGCYTLLKNYSPIIMMEYAQRNLNLTNTKQSDLYDYLDTLGYYLYQYDYITKKFSTVNREDVYEYINVIATKEKLKSVGNEN
jgi:FkbM family methyltransferase